MTASYSLYLEMLRVIATLIVFVSHSSMLLDPLSKNAWLDHFGRDGVIFFFVLSGYVISWCANERDHTATTYAVNRASRIYSVALPALALALAVTLVLCAIGSTPELDYRLKKLWLYLPIWLSFTGNVWYLNETPPNNFPYWSLYYEVWYYVMFAVFFYMQGRWRWPLLALLAAMVGPSILQLGVLWLAGSLLYFHGHRIQWSQRMARVVGVATAAGYVLTKALAFDDVLDSCIAPVWLFLFGSTEHAPDQRFGDYWIGLFVVANMLSAQRAQWQFRARAEQAIRTLAAYSFSTYLYHIPLYGLLMFVLPDRRSIAQSVIALALCIVGIVVLGRLTEQRKRGWRAVFQRLADRLHRRAVAPRPPLG